MKRWQIVGLLFVVGAGLLMATVGEPDGRTTVAGAVEDVSHEVTYRWSGTARSASVTIENSQGNTEQASNAAVPEDITFQSRDDMLFLYLSAQNNGESGTLLCELVVDGIVVETSRASGAYTICDVSGRLGDYYSLKLLNNAS
jgi:hypothetical protein